MRKPEVMILLSTYNGEQYLDEQIESLVAQENVGVNILVRDDGSSDGTCNILNRYQNSGVLTWYSGDNLKPMLSFLDLIVKAPDCEYYAFCDQDDFWLPNKLHRAIECFGAFPKTEPCLYYGRPIVVDSQLNKISSEFSSESPAYISGLASSMVTANATGCTMVFNRELLYVLRSQMLSCVVMHDYWVQKIALIISANMYYDNSVPILYRQHSNNVIGASVSPAKKWKSRLSRLISHGKLRSSNAIKLYEMLENILNDEDKHDLKLIVDYRKSIRNRIMLVTNKKFRTSSVKQNLRFIFAVLSGIY